MVAAAAVASSVVSAESASAESTRISYDDFVSLLKRAFTENPEIFNDAVMAWQNWQREKQEQAIKKAFVDSFAEIFENTNVPRIGADKPKVLIAEFYDFNCIFCRKMHDVLMSVLEVFRDDAAIVMHGFPVLSPGSEVAERVAFAFWRQNPGRYKELVSAFYREGAVATEEDVRQTFESLNSGIPWSRLKSSPDYEIAGGMVSWRRSFAQTASIQGTPFFALTRIDLARANPDRLSDFIRIAAGALPEEAMVQIIKDLLSLN